jgi:hypothetical protein
MRKLNDMFHIEGERLVKTSNGQFVPEDEPLFILRGRDALAADAISHYIRNCTVAGTPPDRIQQLRAVLAKFDNYARNERKIPGVTHGA